MPETEAVVGAINNAPKDDIVLLFENSGKEGRNVNLMITISAKGKITAVDFLPKAGDSHAESWCCWFFNNYVHRYTMMAELYLRGFRDYDLVICDAEAFTDGKCEYRLPSPLGKFLWDCLKDCGLIRCGRSSKNYGLMVVHDQSEAKGFRIVPRYPPE
jgi:hypothetical protein